MREAEPLSETVARALAEDLGGGDVTSEVTVPEQARGRARVVQKQPGVVFGLAAVAEAIVRVLTDADLARRLGEGGRRLAETRFSYDAFRAGVEQLIGELPVRGLFP